jgi:NTP pyrophosphatase (non-canonical NTP hydrolase)
MKKPSINGLLEMQIATARSLFEAAAVPPQDRINRAILALTAEVGELTQALSPGWRWWPHQDKGRAVAEDELADVLLFVLLIAGLADVSGERLLERAEQRLSYLRLRNRLPES